MASPHVSPKASETLVPPVLNPLLLSPGSLITATPQNTPMAPTIQPSAHEEPIALPIAEEHDQQGQINRINRAMQVATSNIRLVHSEFRQNPLSGLVECLRDIKGQIHDKVVARIDSLEEAPDDLMGRFEILMDDFETLLIRVGIAAKKGVHTDLHSVHLGNFGQFSPQLPDGSPAPDTARSSCAGTAGTALERFMQMSPEQFDALAANDDQTAFPRFIDQIVLDGIDLHARILDGQMLEQAMIISQGIAGVAGPDADLNSEHVSFTSDLAESDHFQTITRLSATTVEFIGQNTREYFRTHLTHLIDLGHGRGFPVGAAITCRNEIYALAILSPTKIIFFDSHGTKETTLQTDNAYVLSFDSIWTASRFLADRMPFERIDANQVNPEVITQNTLNDLTYAAARRELGREAGDDAVARRARELLTDEALIQQAQVQGPLNVQATIDALHARNRISFCPVKLRHSVTPPLGLSADDPSLAARITSTQPALLAPIVGQRGHSPLHIPAFDRAGSVSPDSPFKDRAFDRKGAESPDSAFGDRAFDRKGEAHTSNDWDRLDGFTLDPDPTLFDQHPPLRPRTRGKEFLDPDAPPFSNRLDGNRPPALNVPDADSDTELDDIEQAAVQAGLRSGPVSPTSPNMGRAMQLSATESRRDAGNAGDLSILLAEITSCLETFGSPEADRATLSSQLTTKIGNLETSFPKIAENLFCHVPKRYFLEAETLAANLSRCKNALMAIMTV